MDGLAGRSINWGNGREMTIECGFSPFSRKQEKDTRKRKKSKKKKKGKANDSACDQCAAAGPSAASGNSFPSR